MVQQFYAKKNGMDWSELGAMDCKAPVLGGSVQFP